MFVFLVSPDCCVAFLTMPRVRLQFVSEVFPEYSTHLLFMKKIPITIHKRNIILERPGNKSLDGLKMNGNVSVREREQK